MSFREWMKQVNQEVIRIAGVSVQDLADQPFRDWYESEITPHEAAIELLVEEGFPFDE